ncbi:pancreatic lipase-related protein 3 [Drosophila obscura]|uniref:pancreatic lipase-related protein 3 n=1 Tax=Drosophila obscura TaxID=7282 RepID=UPI001BB2BE5B|nr:pancreatic lipase-related protein 3 [Drosophila obscura]
MPTRAFLLLALALASAATAVHGQAAGFLLYTRRTAESPQTLEPEVESLVRSSFYAADPIVLSLPRWLGNSSAPEHSAVVAAQLEQRECNVITVDLAETTDEAAITESVGSLIELLNRNFDVPLARILLVGFAEGAHLAGAVAAKVQTALGQRLPQLTALDPTEASLQHVLSPSDAQFVEVVHTNGGGLGTLERLGHVDYYPNGGETQPGCVEDSCSHERSFELLAEMWSPENDFVSALCGSVETMNVQNCRWTSLKMGQRSQREPTPGIYFLETRSAQPFARGAYHISFL